MMKTLMTHNRTYTISMLAVLAVSFLLTVAVYRYAWVAEDSFITLRYVANTLAGHGPVFNIGERVQGYTHPLWFIVLLCGSGTGIDPIYVAIGCGLLFTFITIAVLGYTAVNLSPKSYRGLKLTVLFGLICGTSEPWMTFQTSGLENSLSHLLITLLIVEAYVHGTARPLRMTALISLLALNRPDLIILAAPLGFLLLARNRTGRAAIKIAAGLLPAVIWLLFAWRYYGTVVPNTAYAKVGIYPHWTAAVKQGLLYLKDWCRYDPLAAGSVFLFISCGLCCWRSRRSAACAGGIVLFLCWLIWIGGDFMRGRMFLPALNASLVFGTLAAAGRERGDDKAFSRQTAAGIMVLIALLAIKLWMPDPGPAISEDGIVSEHRFYPGYHLDSYRRRGRLTNPYIDLEFADHLRAYAEFCGPVTIHLRNPGTFGYLAGPRVSIIDTLGLTDAFIARLPKEYLVARSPRPGHPDKRIPVNYLASRGDISIVPDWKQAVMKKDCSLVSKLEPYLSSDDLISVR